MLIKYLQKKNGKRILYVEDMQIFLNFNPFIISYTLRISILLFTQKIYFSTFFSSSHRARISYNLKRVY